MFESHFGLNAPPFQLSPDPRFYFESRAHAHTLAYMKFGLYQAEGFVVVTGEVGAGKTLLVRRLLNGLDRARLVAAHLLSTQLEPEQLLHSIAAAFGVPSAPTGKARTIATLEAFLTAVAVSGRRALLIVDEAQKLHPESVEELRLLSNFQIGHRALLQSFLVGQPELRGLLAGRRMEALRQRVIASCHLSALGAEETRAYVDHRLRRAGWKGSPAFDPSAYPQIHAHTGGVPRRINLLCTRLMLGAFIDARQAITADHVRQAGLELSDEQGQAAGAAPAL